MIVLRKLSEKLRNGIKIWVIDQNNTWICVDINNLKTAWPTNNFNAILEFLRLLLRDAYVIFQKSVKKFGWGAVPP